MREYVNELKKRDYLLLLPVTIAQYSHSRKRFINATKITT